MGGYLIFEVLSSGRHASVPPPIPTLPNEGDAVGSLCNQRIEVSVAWKNNLSQ